MAILRLLYINNIIQNRKLANAVDYVNINADGYVNFIALWNKKCYI